MATQHSNDFSATHQITVKVGRARQNFFVMLDDKDSDVAGHGPAYTREEWESGSCADWERTADGWLFQGSVPIGETEAFKVRQEVRFETPPLWQVEIWVKESEKLRKKIVTLENALWNPGRKPVKKIAKLREKAEAYEAASADQRPRKVTSYVRI